MSQDTRPFPFRAVIDGTVRGWAAGKLLNAAGKPDARENDIWVYRMGRDVSEGTLGDPREVVVTFWLGMDGEDVFRVQHAHLLLVFADRLEYSEVVC